MGQLEILELASGAAIQDAGRPGYRRYGVTGGGAMDAYALAEGQALLGNSPDAAALEMYALGGSFRCTGNLRIAASGGEMELWVNGAAARWRMTIDLADGDMLRIGRSKQGVLGYLHLQGGIDSPTALGSRSTHLSSGLGWSPSAGDVLRPLSDGCVKHQAAIAESGNYRRRVIRVVDGPQSCLFSVRDRDALVSSGFAVSVKRDRMGIRLESETCRFDAAAGLTLASDAIMPGDIQVSGDGIATVLMADSQPVGGYPRIANVISADQHVLAQFQPGTVFRFERVSHDEAVAALKMYGRQIAGLPERVEPAIRDPETIRDLLAYSVISGVVAGDEHHED